MFINKSIKPLDVFGLIYMYVKERHQRMSHITILFLPEHNNLQAMKALFPNFVVKKMSHFNIVVVGSCRSDIIQLRQTHFTDTLTDKRHFSHHVTCTGVHQYKASAAVLILKETFRRQ